MQGRADALHRLRCAARRSAPASRITVKGCDDDRSGAGRQQASAFIRSASSRADELYVASVSSRQTSIAWRKQMGRSSFNANHFGVRRGFFRQSCLSIENCSVLFYLSQCSLLSLFRRRTTVVATAHPWPRPARVYAPLTVTRCAKAVYIHVTSLLRRQAQGIARARQKS
jgi:hypothetical protein